MIEKKLDEWIEGWRANCAYNYFWSEKGGFCDGCPVLEKCQQAYNQIKKLIKLSI